MSASTNLRRSLLTLTHQEVLNILTKVQQPRCLRDQINGLYVDLNKVRLFMMAVNNCIYSYRKQAHGI